MGTFYSPTGNPECWDTKPAGYFDEDEWLRLNPTPTPVEVQHIPAEEREIAYRMESDALRDTALSYKMEAEGWEDAGETDRAARAYKKYQDALTEWLHKKEEIRMAHPDDGSGA